MNAQPQPDMMYPELLPWEGCGMRVIIRPVTGHERCYVEGCARPWGRDYRCPEHRGIEPKTVYIEISFSREGRERIRRDLDGDPLSLEKARKLKTRIEQDAKLAATEAQARRQIMRHYVPANREKTRFSAVREEYLMHLGRKGAGKKHITCTASALNRHMGVFDPMYTGDINAGMVEDWLYSVKLSDYMKNKLLIYLRRVLRFAALRDYIQVVPELPTWERNSRKRVGLTAPQQGEIMAHIPLVHRPIFEFYVRLGWRPGEVRALKVSDIRGDSVFLNGSFDLEEYKPYPKVRGKGGAEYPKGPVADVISRALAGRVYGPDDYVFTPPRGGAHYTARGLARVFEKARKLA